MIKCIFFNFILHQSYFFTIIRFYKLIVKHWTGYKNLSYQQSLWMSCLEIDEFTFYQHQHHVWPWNLLFMSGFINFLLQRSRNVNFIFIKNVMVMMTCINRFWTCVKVTTKMERIEFTFECNSNGIIPSWKFVNKVSEGQRRFLQLLPFDIVGSIIPHFSSQRSWYSFKIRVLDKVLGISSQQKIY